MSNQKKEGTSLLYALFGEARTYDDAIIMGRGDPDFDTPEHVVAAAKEAMIKNHSDYVPPEGLLALREAIARRVKDVNNIDVDPNTEIVVTNGGQEALFLMVMAVTSAGSEMIVPEPNYNTYNDALAFAGGVKVDIPTFPKNDFRADPEDVRRAVTDKTSSLLLVSPNNPSANVISPNDMKSMLQIATDHDLIVLADDIYDLFVYDGFEHVSPASLPGGKERTLTLNALSKAYSMTGWRLGWVVGPADLMTKVKELKTALNGGTSIIAQYAGIAALTGTQEPVEMMADAYRKRRKMVLEALDDMGMSYGMPQGGQFVFADISFTGMGSAEVAQKLLTDQHVLAYPGEAFSKDRKDYLRMTFLQPEDKLKEGLERMKIGMQNIMGNR
ncbi:MAG: aminotransferase class I/II-fold pyridoxal phosphate-dependent enzyme [Phototrophicaceae bacterium]